MFIVLSVVFALNIISLFIKSGSNGQNLDYSIYSFANLTNTPGIIAYILKILMYASVIPLLASIISFFNKKNNYFYIPVIYYFIFECGLIAFHIFSGFVSAASISVIIINIALLLVCLTLLIVSKKLFKEEELIPLETEASKEVKISSNLIGLIDIILIVGSIVFFTTPLVITLVNGTQYSSLVLFRVLIDDYQVLDVVLFAIYFVFYLFLIIQFISTIPYYFSNKVTFVKKSNDLCYGVLAFGLVHFLISFSLEFYYKNNGTNVTTYSYIPFIVICLFVIIFAIFKGKYDFYNNEVKENKSTKLKYFDFEPLAYLIITVIISVAMLFLNIIKVDFDSSYATESIRFTGIDLLRDFGSLKGAGYQLLAYFLVVMLIINGIGLIISLAAYFTRYHHFKMIVRVSVYTNIGLVFLFGIAGIYYIVATAINAENLSNLIAYYAGSSAQNYKYSLTTDAIYALIPDVIILAITFARKAFEGDKSLSIEGNDSSSTSGAKNGLINNEDGFNNFDPCPGFSEVDEKKDELVVALSEKEKSEINNPSLNGLVNFVVNYAKNSRLHLSYTEQDIATFIAGLGACRLSILQGMSGTGKTSLPKIFTEAIGAECNIIEVESSWKDKNELIGYYNEFSKEFTPKKFTLALYKATLNQNVPTFIVLDEMNLSRIEYYFSDFLSLMENEEDKRFIKLVNVRLNKKVNGESVNYLSLIDGHTLKISPNVWFIGTANKDESTFVISDKVYDRAHTMNFTKRANKVMDYTTPLNPIFYSYKDLSGLFAKAKNEQKFNAETNLIIKSVEQLLLPYNISFGNRILNQIEAFVKIYKACFPTKDVEAEAVESILLSKVVAKLEVKTIDNKDELLEAFEKLGLHRCVEFISKLDED